MTGLSNKLEEVRRNVRNNVRGALEDKFREWCAAADIRLQMAFSTAFPVTCQRMMATALRQRFIFSHRQGRAFITCPNVLSVTRVSPSAFVVLFEGCDNLIVRSECGHHFSGYLRRTPTGAPA